jgi:D-alanine-D-alanine ligase
VGVLGKQALPVIEIIPPAGGEFDYENKYNGKTQELCPPVHVAEDLQRQAQNLAEQIHSAAGCRDMSRTDFIIRNDGSIYLLETNTIPGMTSQSLYPKMAATAGISFPDLCDRLVQMALSR